MDLIYSPLSTKSKPLINHGNTGVAGWESRTLLLCYAIHPLSQVGQGEVKNAMTSDPCEWRNCVLRRDAEIVQLLITHWALALLWLVCLKQFFVCVGIGTARPNAQCSSCYLSKMSIVVALFANIFSKPKNVRDQTLCLKKRKVFCHQWSKRGKLLDQEQR